MVMLLQQIFAVSYCPVNISGDYWIMHIGYSKCKMV